MGCKDELRVYYEGLDFISTSMHIGDPLVRSHVSHTGLVQTSYCMGSHNKICSTKYYKLMPAEVQHPTLYSTTALIPAVCARSSSVQFGVGVLISFET